jgi:hypothetical protein
LPDDEDQVTKRYGIDFHRALPPFKGSSGFWCDWGTGPIEVNAYTYARHLPRTLQFREFTANLAFAASTEEAYHAKCQVYQDFYSYLLNSDARIILASPHSGEVRRPPDVYHPFPQSETDGWTARVMAQCQYPPHQWKKRVLLALPAQGPPLGQEVLGWGRPGLPGLSGELPLFPGLAQEPVQLLAQGLQLLLPFGVDGVDFLVVGDGFQGDAMTGWLEYYVEGLTTQLAEVRQRGEQAIRLDVLVKQYGLSDRQAGAIKHILEHGSLTIQKFERLCPDVNRRTLQRDLKAMVNEGVLLSEGATNQLIYQIKG